MSLTLQSRAFADGEPIPRRYTCDGEDVSPPLTWAEAPAEARSFALVVDDPDAPGGTWVHWIVFNLPADASSLPEHAAESGGMPAGVIEGTNSWGRPGYGGPCPPSGTHRYFFKLYALDAMLDLPTTATGPDVARTMEGHVLEQATLMGRYARG